MVCIGQYSIRATILRVYVTVVSGTVPMSSKTRAPRTTPGALCTHSRGRCLFLCGYQVMLVDEARAGIPIKADIVEGIERKALQDNALCSNFHAHDGVDESNPVAGMQ